MAAPATNTGTEAPGNAGFPPFNTATYPSQIFWLTVTFAALLIFMWKVATPRIAGVIGERKGRIQTELARAEESRKEAERAAAAYQAPILEARERARAASEAARSEMARESERANAMANEEVLRKTTDAQARIAAMQKEARAHITAAAEDAVVEIVARLTGDRISRDEAAAAVRDAVKV